MIFGIFDQLLQKFLNWFILAKKEREVRKKNFFKVERDSGKVEREREKERERERDRDRERETEREREKHIHMYTFLMVRKILCHSLSYILITLWE